VLQVSSIAKLYLYLLVLLSHPTSFCSKFPRCLKCTLYLCTFFTTCSKSLSALFGILSVIYLQAVILNVSYASCLSSRLRTLPWNHVEKWKNMSNIFITQRQMEVQVLLQAPATLSSGINLQLPIFWYFADRASQYIYLDINQLDALNFIMSIFHASTCFGHTCLSSGGQNCTIQSLVSSRL